jgi:hypothetical protein
MKHHAHEDSLDTGLLAMSDVEVSRISKKMGQH